MALNVTVTIKDHPHPLHVEVINPDRVRWDMTAHKHKWPSFADAPFLGTTFLSWAALRRMKAYDGTFEDFRDRDCLNIEHEDDEDEKDEVEGVGNPI